MTPQFRMNSCRSTLHKTHSYSSAGGDDDVEEPSQCGTERLNLFIAFLSLTENVVRTNVAPDLNVLINIKINT